MDHLALPQSPHSQPSKVRCVCTDDELFDNGSFATFPIRRGWPEFAGQDDSHPYYITAAHELVTTELTRQREKFLQAWVFFGLLHEVFSPFALYHTHQYIETDATGARWVHTKGLNDRIAEWNSILATVDTSKRHDPVVHLRTCLRLATEALMSLNNKNFKDFDRMIKLSLLGVCTTIKGMILSQLGEGIYTFKPGIELGDDILDREAMLANGWCPSEVTKVQFQHSSHFMPVWYLQHLRKSDSPAAHENCTNEVCNKSQVTGALRPRHVDPSCDCAALGPDLQDILRCLMDDDIPVLEIQGEDLSDLTIVVHPLSTLDKAEASYIAISHVWAHGLGNSDDTTLPRCQVRRLNQLLLDMKKHTFIVGEDETTYMHRNRVMLWCDSLCVPVAQEYKALSMGKMRDVYLNASFVLVLDRTLEKYSYAEIGLVEAGWRILLSQWMGRFWTYQEAGLAKRLIVQFADAPVSILPIMRTASQMWNDSPVRDFTYIYVAAGLALIRGWQHAEPRTAWIREAVMGLCHRRVSYASDEPICIGTVLGLDSEELTGADPAQRAATLWRLIAQHERGISESVIFNTLDRMTQPGYRWAPASFLQSIELPTDFVVLADDAGKGVLMARGLRVRRAGWRLQHGKVPGSLPDSFWPDIEGIKFVRTRHPDGSCYNILQTSIQDSTFTKRSLLPMLSDTNKEWYLILQRPETSFEYVAWTSQQRALIVSKELDEYGLIYYQSQLHVVVDRLRPGLELRRKAEDIYGETIHKSWTLLAFNMLVLVENCIVSGLTWLPALIRTRATGLCDPIFMAGGRKLGTRLKSMIIGIKTEAPKLPQVAKLLQDPLAEAVKGALGSEIVPAFMGRYADIVEVFDLSTEWCVD